MTALTEKGYLRGMYEITSNDERVALWLGQRLPHLWPGKKTESNAALYEPLELLRKNLSTLRCPDGRHLEAILYDTSSDRFDLENVLFFNVGSSPFSHLLRRRLSFSRRWQRPPSSPEGRDFAYFAEYRITETKPLRHGDGVTVSFDWPKRLSVKTDLAWWSATAASKSGFDGIKGRYTLDITLEADPRMKLTVDKLKCFVDGLISSLHFDYDPAEAAVEKLAARNRWPMDEVRRRLMEPPNPVLGARKVFTGAWAPADELCDACNIEIIEADQPRCTFTVSASPVS